MRRVISHDLPTRPYHPENTLFDEIHVLDRNRASNSHRTQYTKRLGNTARQPSNRLAGLKPPMLFVFNKCGAQKRQLCFFLASKQFLRYEIHTFVRFLVPCHHFFAGRVKKGSILAVSKEGLAGLKTHFSHLQNQNPKASNTYFSHHTVIHILLNC